VRVPDEAGNGKAKATISFAAWKKVTVAPTTIDVPITELLPRAQGKGIGVGAAGTAFLGEPSEPRGRNDAS
jgi:hypothetical protein